MDVTVEQHSQKHKTRTFISRYKSHIYY